MSVHAPPAGNHLTMLSLQYLISKFILRIVHGNHIVAHGLTPP